MAAGHHCACVRTGLTGAASLRSVEFTPGEGRLPNLQPCTQAQTDRGEEGGYLGKTTWTCTVCTLGWCIGALTPCGFWVRTCWLIVASRCVWTFSLHWQRGCLLNPLPDTPNSFNQCLLVLVWVYFICFSFHPQPKNMQIRASDSKVAVDVWVWIVILLSVLALTAQGLALARPWPGMDGQMFGLET